MLDAQNNSYRKADPAMFDRLLSIVKSSRKGYTLILHSKNNSDLLRWINNSVPMLADSRYKLVTKLYWIFNDLHEIPVCRRAECDHLLKNVQSLAKGYNGGYCSSYCAANDYDKRQEQRLKAEQQYGEGITCYQQTEEFRHAASERMHSRSDYVRQNTIARMKKTWKAKPAAEIQAINTRRERTCIAKYGVRVSSQSKQVKAAQVETNLRKYGAVTPLVNSKIRAAFDQTAINLKRDATKRKNRTFTVSAPEEAVYHLLCQKFGINDVQRQHKTTSYPFLCDFYIVSKDLYIEYQGSWTHGPKPFDKNDCDCQKLLLKWTERASIKPGYYHAAIYVWTDLDVRKRSIAAANHLNYLEFFTLQQVKDWLNSLGRII